MFPFQSAVYLRMQIDDILGKPNLPLFIFILLSVQRTD